MKQAIRNLLRDLSLALLGCLVVIILVIIFYITGLAEIGNNHFCEMSDYKFDYCVTLK